MYDVIIVGAGCAGLTAAVYALRAGKTVLILEAETIGGQISSSPKVENFPSIKSISGAEFSSNLFDQATDLGADFELDRVEKVINGDVKKVITEYGEYECKALILATGVKHRKLDLENVDDYEGNGISYCAVCDGAFFKGKDLVVVGGGDSAVEEGAFLTKMVVSTALANLVRLSIFFECIWAVCLFPCSALTARSIASSILETLTMGRIGIISSS